jgi:hypothetical protein
MKIKSASWGCNKYLVAQDTCTSNGVAQDNVTVQSFPDHEEPPLTAQWSIVDGDATGTKFKLVNLGRQNAGCGKTHLAANWLTTGKLYMDAEDGATEFAIEIHERTPYHQIKVAAALPNQIDYAFLANPVTCEEGALPRMNRSPDLFSLMPATLATSIR